MLSSLLRAHSGLARNAYVGRLWPRRTRRGQLRVLRRERPCPLTSGERACAAKSGDPRSDGGRVIVRPDSAALLAICARPAGYLPPVSLRPNTEICGITRFSARCAAAIASSLASDAGRAARALGGSRQSDGRPRE